MDKKKLIEKIVLECVHKINSTRIEKKKIDKNLQSDLSILDSLGLVMLILKIEEEIFIKYKKEVRLNHIISSTKKKTLEIIINEVNAKI